MKKLILAIVLVVTTAPALAAAYQQTHYTQNNRDAAAVPERHRQAQGESSDPYWTPCDYSDDTSAQGCN